jgi:hypothetical protein
MELSVTLVGDREVDAALAEFPRKASRVMVRALNRAATSGRLVLVQNIAADTGLKSATVRAALTLRDATPARPEARIAASLKRIPLIDFNAKGPEPSRGRGRGVSYKLRGGGGRLPHAFIATMASGHRGVFMRSRSARLPIGEKFGPSLGHVLGKYRPAAITRARESFLTTFRHDMGFDGAARGAD